MKRKRIVSLILLLTVSLVSAGLVVASEFRTASAPPTPQTTSTDIEILNLTPGVASGIHLSEQCFQTDPTSGFCTFDRFITAFSFAPKGFIQANRVILNYVVVSGPGANFPLDSFRGSLNNFDAGENPAGPQYTNIASPVAFIDEFPAQSIRVGLNLISLTPTHDTNIPFGTIVAAGLRNYSLFEVRLTVEYNFTP